MFDSLWAAAPGRRCIAAIRGKRKLHFWFDNNNDALIKAKELDAEGFNVYFAPSLFDSELVEKRREEINPKTGNHYTGREQSTVSMIPALWIDLDAGEDKDYETADAAFEAFSKWVSDNKIPNPTQIVSSGYGLHIYWRFPSPVTHREWLPAAKHLKQACRVGGLAIDPSRTADSASLMRVPDTHNHKRGNLAPVRVLADTGTTVDLHAFRAALPMVGPIGTVTAPVSHEWDTSVRHPPGDAHKIADKCQQIGQVRFHKGKVEEPLWRAGLSIIWRCQDGEKLIHEWSVGDDRYDYDETQEKAENTAGPATCQHFAEINAEGCIGCPFAGTVRSPISLAYAEEVPEAAEDDFTSVRGYVVNNSGVFMQPLGDGGGPLTKIADFPIWIEDSQEVISPFDPSLKTSLVLGWEDVRGIRRSVPITMAKLHDDRQWVAWLSDNNLISFCKDKPMRNYISQMHKARYKDKGARSVYSSLGWYNDHSLFVFGQKGATIDGLIDVSVDIKSLIAGMEPTGSLAAWKDGMQCLAKPELAPQAFGLLCGFAAPLLDLVDRDGAVVVFAGQSGVGKTMAARAALSIFADSTQRIFESATSSDGGIGLHFAEYRHLPVLVDEVTNMHINRLRDLIYMAANGSPRTTLTQRRERRNMASWKTVTMLTSNHSLLDRRLADIEEAHRRRVVEVPVLHKISDEDSTKLYTAIRDNHGVAVGPYIQFLLKHKDAIAKLFPLIEKQISAWGYENSADRFAIWTCSAALLGGILARLAGVIAFDPIPAVREVVQQSAANMNKLMDPEEHARQALFELLASESRRICVWPAGKIASVDVDNPIARIDGEHIFVRSGELRERWQEEHIFLPSIRGWVGRVAEGGKTVSYRLAPGTPQLSCYKFNMEKLGWDSEQITEG